MNDHEMDVLLQRAMQDDKEPSATLNLQVINSAKQYKNQQLLRKQYKTGFVTAFCTYLVFIFTVSTFLLLMVIGNLYLQILYLLAAVVFTAFITVLLLIGLRYIQQERGVIV